MKIQEVPSVTGGIPESEIVSGQPIPKAGQRVFLQKARDGRGGGGAGGEGGGAGGGGEGRGDRHRG